MTLLEISGLEKKECNRHQNATDTPKGLDNCLNCIAVEYYNAPLTALSTMRVDEEKLADLLKPYFYEPGIPGIETPHGTTLREEIATAILAALPNIVTKEK